ncbi:uncharacterized protein [Dermacentor albipictus]|uniref:uncharacterized protein isoform X2 n=1 Tax=Dermacentor albipictus TaxID=60249 RepID=UPI0031FD7598
MCMLATIVLRITAAVGLLYAGWHGLKKIGVEYPGISCWNASRLLGVGRSNHRDEGIYVMIPKVYNAMRNGCYLSGEWLLGGRLTQMLTHLEVGEWLQRCTHALTRLEWLLNQHVCHAVLLLSLLLAIAIAYRWFTKDTEKPKNVGSVATTPARNLSPFTATERSAFSPARYTSSSSWFVGDDDDDSFPIRPRTLRDVMLGSTWEDGEPYSGGLHEREAPSVSSTDSSRSFESPSEVAYHTLTDDADAQDVSDSEDGAVYELRRQQAAARVIQDWTRTGFQQWLQERGPRLTDVPLRAAPENSLDEDFGAVFPTIADSSEIGATLMWQPGRQSSEDDLPGGSLAVNVSPEKDMAEEHVPRSNLGAGKSQSLKADPEMTKIPESNVSENDVAWSSDETTYARFPSRLSPSGSPRSSISPEDGNGVDSNDGAHAQQLFVQLPEPLPRTPVDQLLPGPSSEKIFGELLRECKHGVPLTFEAMLEDIGADGCVKLCEGGVYTEVFRTCGTRGGAVLKVLHPAYLVRHLNLVLTEVRIARSLRSLSMDVDNNTRGFAELRAVYAVWDKYPEVMVNACVNYHSRKNFSLFSDVPKCPPDPLSGSAGGTHSCCGRGGPGVRAPRPDTCSCSRQRSARPGGSFRSEWPRASCPCIWRPGLDRRLFCGADDSCRPSNRFPAGVRRSDQTACQEESGTRGHIRHGLSFHQRGPLAIPPVDQHGVPGGADQDAGQRVRQTFRRRRRRGGAARLA